MAMDEANGGMLAMLASHADELRQFQKLQLTHQADTANPHCPCAKLTLSMPPHGIHVWLQPIILLPAMTHVGAQAGLLYSKLYMKGPRGRVIYFAFLKVAFCQSFTKGLTLTEAARLPCRMLTCRALSTTCSLLTF